MTFIFESLINAQ